MFSRRLTKNTCALPVFEKKLKNCHKQLKSLMAKFTEKACSQSFAAGRKVLQKLEDEFIPKNTKTQTRAVARALIGGGGGYIHIFVLRPTDFF